MRFPGKEGTKPVEKVVPRCLAACSVLRGIIRENKHVSTIFPRAPAWAWF